MILNAKFLAVDAHILVFDTQFLVLNAKFIIFTHLPSCTAHTCHNSIIFGLKIPSVLGSKPIMLSFKSLFLSVKSWTARTQRNHIAPARRVLRIHKSSFLNRNSSFFNRNSSFFNKDSSFFNIKITFSARLLVSRSDS